MQPGADSALERIARLSAGEWRLLGRAAAELLLARIRFAVLPAREILRSLEPRTGRAKPHHSRDKLGPAGVAWAIAVAGARVPWRADCLIRAMAASRWLRRQGHSPQVFLGVALAGQGAFGAHAWVRCGDIVVTGGDGRSFAPILPLPPS